MINPRPYKVMRYLGNGAWEIYGSCETKANAEASIAQYRSHLPGEFRILLEV
jgi:hypothetical protein